MSARPLPMPTNPALLKHADQRRQHLENRIADTITPLGRPPAQTAPSSYPSRPKEVAMTTAESSVPAGAQTITEHELAQCELANQTGRTPYRCWATRPTATGRCR